MSLPHASSDETLRETGVEPIGALPWGAHICLFFDTAEDLVETHARYFQAGLERSEMCIWAISEPLTNESAMEGLRADVPDFDGYLARGQIELVSGYEWYLGGEDFALERITGAWHAKLAEALARGYSGLRVSGNAFWFEADLWESFRAYEAALEKALEGRKMLALCSYSLARSRAVEILDVTRVHHFSIARRRGRWEFLSTPELAAARTEIGKLNNAIDILSRPGLELLTPRERVMLAQLAIGATNKEAARAMNISPRTAEFHRANILRKLEARNSTELLARVLGGHGATPGSGR